MGVYARCNPNGGGLHLASATWEKLELQKILRKMINEAKFFKKIEKLKKWEFLAKFAVIKVITL